MEQYLQMLSDSLEKKSELLNKLTEKTKEQTETIGKEQIDWDTFDSLVEDKTTMIQDLESVEEGFDALYDRIRDELLANKDKYRSQIEKLQSQISKVMEQSASLMALEERNKAQVTSKLTIEKQKIKQGRVSSRVATNYYRNMSKINYIDPQLMDKKK